MAFYGRLFRFLRVLVRPFVYLNKKPDLSDIPDPAVFICRHRNLRGPIFSLLHMPREVHPWAYSVFCDKKMCFDHYMNYTFSVRLQWRPLTTRIVAWLLSRLVPSLIKSMGSIPVYRKSMRVKDTFNQSVASLRRGENVIIYPDVDYVSTDDNPGEIYTGFLLLGQLYRKTTGKNLNFVALDIDMQAREILVGKPIEFDGKRRNFNEEKMRVAAALRAELARLGKLNRSSEA